MTKKQLQNKPSRKVRLILYPIIGTIFALLLAGLILLANGYLPDYANGKLTFKKTGMIILAVRPMDAKIYINSVYKENTSVYLLPNKLNNLLPASYNIRIEKKGYRTWEKNIKVEPGLVTWANYILMFADKLDIKTVDAMTTKPITINENGRYLLFGEVKDGKYVATSYESNGLSTHSFWPKDVSALPEWLKVPQVVSASYSQNSDRVLYQVKNGETTQFVVSETSGNDAKLVILNDQLKVAPASVSWNPYENDSVFLIEGGKLYREKISAVALGTPLVTDIVSYKFESNRQLYYARKAASGNISIEKCNSDGTSKVTILDSIVPASSYQFGHTPDTDMLAVRSRDSGDLLLIYPANGENNVVLRLGKGYRDISWQKDGKKMLYYTDNAIYRYDVERKKETHFSYSGKISSILWYFDDCHILINGENGLEIAEYDGANRLVLSFTEADDVALDQQNSNLLYSLKKDTGSEFFRFNNPH